MNITDIQKAEGLQIGQQIPVRICVAPDRQTRRDARVAAGFGKSIAPLAFPGTKMKLFDGRQTAATVLPPDFRAKFRS